MDYRQIAILAAKRYGIDPDVFVRQINQESGFNPSAKSPAGALGIAQIVPKWHPGVDPYDPVASLNYAAKWMSELYHRYGSYERALSVYNSGKPDAYKDPSFSGGQTYDYVRKIMGAGALPYTGQDPGFKTLPVEKGFHPEIHNMLDRVARPDFHQVAQEGLAALAQGAYNPTQQLANLLASQQAPEEPSIGSPKPTVPPVPVGPGTTFPAPTKGKGGLAEAFYDPLGQWDNGRFSKQGIGGHTDHVHLSITNPQSMLFAIKKAQQLGLHVGENPYVGDVNPVHVKGSFHYRDFPGEYNGKKLGEAIDVSGDPKLMSAFFRWALANLR